MDYVLDYMKKNNVPMTRENYLSIAYFGNPPSPLPAEEEAALPEQFKAKESNSGVEALSGDSV